MAQAVTLQTMPATGTEDAMGRCEQLWLWGCLCLRPILRFRLRKKKTNTPNPASPVLFRRQPEQREQSGLKQSMSNVSAGRAVPRRASAGLIPRAKADAFPLTPGQQPINNRLNSPPLSCDPDPRVFGCHLSPWKWHQKATNHSFIHPTGPGDGARRGGGIAEAF